MSSLTRWVLAHKRIVVLGWIALTIAGIAASGPASKRLTNDTSVPNKESWETDLAIAERYHGSRDGSSSPLLPVVTLPAGTTVDSPRVKAELAAVDARLGTALPGARIASYASTGSRAFVSKDGRTAFALLIADQRERRCTVTASSVASPPCERSTRSGAARAGRTWDSRSWWQRASSPRST